MLTIKTDKRGNFLKAKARWVLRCFDDKQKEYQQADSPASQDPERVRTFFELILRPLSFKDTLMM